MRITFASRNSGWWQHGPICKSRSAFFVVALHEDTGRVSVMSNLC